MSPEAICERALDPEIHFSAGFSIARALGDQIVEMKRKFLKTVGQNYGDSRNISTWEGGKE